MIMFILVTNGVVVFSTSYRAKASCIKEIDAWTKQKEVSKKRWLCSVTEANKYLRYSFKTQQSPVQLKQSTVVVQ